MSQTNRLRERQRKAKEFIDDQKKRGCSMCGYCKCLDALVFHHVSSNLKKRVLSKVTTIGVARREIAKCILLCANCHAEIHCKVRLQKVLTATERLKAENLAQLSLWQQ